MAVCKHCGTEIEDRIDYCPNCGQKMEEDFGDFFEPDEALEEEMYNIFDSPEEFDMDSLLSREFNHGTTAGRSESEDSFALEEPTFFEDPAMFETAEEVSDVEELFQFEETEPLQEVSSETEDFAELFGMFDNETSEPEEMDTAASVEAEGDMEFPVAEESDFLALDDLLQDMDSESVETISEEPEAVDQGLEELLAVSTLTTEEETTEKKKKNKKQKKEKKSFFKAVFGNVPVDPSKVKPELTPEQIAAKKAKEAEEKKAKAEEKKLAAEEKKQLSQKNKEEKARQKALAKEEKKAKKMQEAKQILEEMKETRINRVGATIVLVFFAVCAIVLIFGSGIFGYAIGIHSAEKNFNMAYNNDVKYYTDAYNDIYGLEVKPEDQVLNDKIMTVMFVNKHLNSYNSYMVLDNYQAALHSLLLGLYRYGAYYESAIPLGIERDMDYVRTQILKELETTFGVSEDEAELLRSMLADVGASGMNASIDNDAARVYNLKLYEIVEESGLKNDSNN